jgi:predicted RNase H-like HicB family nuclease
MTRYIALLDGKYGAYGVAFPDLPGCVAMGETAEEAITNAGESLREFVIEARESGEAVPQATPLEDLLRNSEVREALSEGATLTSVPLVLPTGKPVKANLSIDEGILRSIDEEAKRRNLTRSSMVELMAKMVLAEV